MYNLKRLKEVVMRDTTTFHKIFAAKRFNLYCLEKLQLKRMYGEQSV